MPITTRDLSDRMVLLCNDRAQILQRSGGDRASWARLLSAGNLFDSLDGKARTTAVTRWEEAVRNGDAFQMPVRFPDSVSQIQTLLLSVSQWFNDAAEPLWIVVVEVISNTLLDSPHEIALGRVVLETAVDAIITIDQRGLIHSVNPATCRMFGYAPEELLSRNIKILMPEPYHSEHDGYLARYLVTRKPSIIGIGRKVTGLRRNGQLFPVHLAVSEFTVDSKSYFTGVIHDLSELDRVQQQLLQSERLAAIGQMVTGLAHESRNALQRVQACMDMLSLDLEHEPDQLDLVRRAGAALHQLHRLYEEVRGYAAPIHLEFRGCRLSTIWHKEWDHLSNAREGKRISLKEIFRGASGEPVPDLVEEASAVTALDYCEVDVHRMEQVFRNVLENAIHACRDSGKVTIHCGPADCDGQPAVQISVIDDGSGMSEETARQIFEPFYTTKQKGTGLGMAIVQRIIGAHLGQITAHANSPAGTEIRIVLPRTQANRNKFR